MSASAPTAASAAVAAADNSAMAAAAPAHAISITEHRVWLPISQLHLCVRIWNAQPGATSLSAPSSGLSSAAAASSATTPPLPAPRAHDVHVVLLHGWLDNAASWDVQCPALIAGHAASPTAARLTAAATVAARAAGTPPPSPSRLVCYCIEFSGHGDSDHRSLTHSTYYAIEHALDMLQAIAVLGLAAGSESIDTPALRVHTKNAPCIPMHVIGHSMGGAIAAMVAGALKASCCSLVLMDSVGPWAPNLAVPLATAGVSRPPPDVVVQKLALALQEHALAGNTRKRVPKLYPSREAIEDKYLQGNPFMDPASARLLARRAVRHVSPEEVVAWSRNTLVDGGAKALRKHPEGGWAFKHDNRLIASAMLQPLEHTTLDSFSLVTCPVTVFLANNALRRALYSTAARDPRNPAHWPLPETNPLFPSVLRQRLECFRAGARLVHVQGDHHIHMDQPAAGKIAAEIVQFIHASIERHEAAAAGQRQKLAADSRVAVSKL